MLKKKAKGSQILSTCENCGGKFKVLFEKNGKKICKNCLNLENKEINTGGFSD